MSKTKKLPREVIKCLFRLAKKLFVEGTWVTSILVSKIFEMSREKQIKHLLGRVRGRMGML